MPRKLRELRRTVLSNAFSNTAEQQDQLRISLRKRQIELTKEIKFYRSTINILKEKIQFQKQCIRYELELKYLEKQEADREREFEEIRKQRSYLVRPTVFK